MYGALTQGLGLFVWWLFKNITNESTAESSGFVDAIVRQ